MGYSNAQTWFFRYQGAGNNAGTVNRLPSPTAGSINRNADAWANEPVLAASGSTLYGGWIETGKPFANGNAYFPHVYASQLTASGWTPLGSAFTALDSEFAGYNEAHAPSMAMVGTIPWISWYKTSNNGLLLPNSLYAKSWNGSSWIGGTVGAVDATATLVVAHRSQLAGVANTPYIAFLENSRRCYPWCQYVYVKQWDGSSWKLIGPGPLNRNATTAKDSPLADSVSIATDGAHPVVAWTEYTQASTFRSNTAPQVYVSLWDGSSWKPMGGSLNVASSGWAYDAAIVYLRGKPYVTWVERSQAGVAQVYVKTWDGAQWTLVGSGTLNKDTRTGWAFRPSLAADDAGNTLYLGWIEQQAFGQKAQAYVQRYTGGAWTGIGGTLNADPIQGSAERISVAVVNGQPVAAWGEVKDGSLRQIYVKQWSGTDWTNINGSASPGALSCDLNGDGQVNVLDVQLAVNQALGVSPCTAADLQQNNVCDVTDIQRVVAASLGGACVIGK
jgi:hypothetical protein